MSHFYRKKHLINEITTDINLGTDYEKRNFDEYTKLDFHFDAFV
jgi:hypothetical protein